MHPLVITRTFALALTKTPSYSAHADNQSEALEKVVSVVPLSLQMMWIVGCGQTNS